MTPRPITGRGRQGEAGQQVPSVRSCSCTLANIAWQCWSGGTQFGVPGTPALDVRKSSASERGVCACARKWESEVRHSAVIHRLTPLKPETLRCSSCGAANACKLEARDRHRLSRVVAQRISKRTHT